MKSEEIHKKYIDYLNNTGSRPVSVSQFDEDWEPVGAMVRKNMKRDDLIQERADGIHLRPDLVRGRG
jgi:hypothetical protein